MAELITMGDDGALAVPDEPIIPFIEGDGTGVDIWPAAKLVLDAAAAKHGRTVAWKEVLAGQKAFDETGNWLPDETVEAFRSHLIGIKGPLTTPVGRGHPLAQRGAAPDPRPLRLPAAGPLVHRRALAGPPPRAGRHGHLPGEHRGRLRRLRGAGGHARGGQAHRLPSRRDGLAHPRRRRASGSSRSREMGSKRLVRAAIRYALEHKRASVTMVHKGNIQKFTEGAFRDWGYELVREEFADVAVGWDDCGGEPGDKLLVKDTIADITLQQVLTRPAEFDVIATTNLNGDYLSDALAAQVGGIGIAPGANINYVTRPRHLRGHSRHGAQVRRSGQGEPRLGAAVGRAHVRAPRVERRGRRHRAQPWRPPSPTRSSPTTSPG